MTDEQPLDIETSVTLRGSASGEVVLREVPLGAAPVVLIEPKVTEEDDNAMKINVDATDFESMEDLADFLEFVVTIIREGAREE